MLVIVESPNKVRTIKTYLGSGYEVIATKGHFRDLPRKHIGNLPEKWEAIRGKSGIITALRKASKRNPDGIVLATDPDREGEGIAWHVCDILGLDPAITPRAVFHEITKSEVQQGVHNAIVPGGTRLNQPLVEAQKARRLIDRRIGYSGTRYLWKTIGGGVSAGRCLIPAAVLLRDINLREDSAGTRMVIKGEIHTSAGRFCLRHVIDKDTPITPEYVSQYLPEDTSSEIPIETMKTFPRTSSPPKPLDTASAIVAIGLSPSSTMRALQSLFEKGLITYHRTTSRVVSDSFRNAVAPPVKGEMSPSITKDDAHEAIRPTGKVIQSPDMLSDSLDDTEKRVYNIVWKHAVGSFYPVWKGETLQVTLGGGWVRTWSRTTCNGANWMSATNCEPAHEFPSEVMELSEGDSVTIISGWLKVIEERAGIGVTESGMVRILKESGIGRPSTYSTIISNLSSRGLAGFIPKKQSVIHEISIGEDVPTEKQEKRPSNTSLSFRITDTGKSCIESLYKSGFAEFFKIEYTSKMESILDSIADSKYPSGWEGFVLEIDKTVTEAEKSSSNVTPSVADKKGAFPETILGVLEDWTYGKGRTRYGPVIWRQQGGHSRREYKKIASKRWHQITMSDAITLLCK